MKHPPPPPSQQKDHPLDSLQKRKKKKKKKKKKDNSTINTSQQGEAIVAISTPSPLSSLALPQEPQSQDRSSNNNNDETKKKKKKKKDKDHNKRKHGPPPSPHAPSMPTINTNKRPRSSISVSSSSSALPSYPYQADYCDHFETPPQAYQDLNRWLHYLSTSKKTKKSTATATSSKADLCIYDPYFCVGTMKQILAGLGFPVVINRMTDFYADQKMGKIPEYDVLVTNPPYSESHKEKILHFCLASEKPWALLMPSYVANKAYYQEAIKKLPEEERPFYLVPNVKYEYTHPEGTGHATSPFFSMWFCHLGKHQQQQQKACLSWLEKPGGGMKSWRVVKTVEGLRSTGAAPSWKRPNNKRRKKMKMAAAAKAAGGAGR